MDRKNKKKKMNLTAIHLKILTLFKYRDIIKIDSSRNICEETYGIKRECFLNSIRQLKTEGLIQEIDKNAKRYKKNFTVESLESDYGAVMIEDNDFISNNMVEDRI